MVHSRKEFRRISPFAACMSSSCSSSVRDFSGPLHVRTTNVGDREGGGGHIYPEYVTCRVFRRGGMLSKLQTAGPEIEKIARVPHIHQRPFRSIDAGASRHHKIKSQQNRRRFYHLLLLGGLAYSPYIPGERQVACGEV
jgi:hypothetical protein